MKYDPDKYTLLYWRDLNNQDKKNHPDHEHCVNAVLEAHDKTVEKPYVVVWNYNLDTYESDSDLIWSYEKSIDAWEELESHHDCICPFKIMAHSENTACDLDDCALFYIDRDEHNEILGLTENCAIFVIAKTLDETKWSVQGACNTYIGSEGI